MSALETSERHTTPRVVPSPHGRTLSGRGTVRNDRSCFAVAPRSSHSHITYTRLPGSSAR
eukprot:3072048-Prymnesium_polylepis.1